MTFLQNIFKLIRVKHWIKNVLIFFPSFFSGDVGTLLSPNLWLLFVSFCFASSIIYILNDVVDCELDKLHPIKKNRPIASGFFNKKQACYIAVVFFGFWVLTLPFMVDSYLYSITYVLLNIAYIFKLKRYSIVDVSCIGIGFVVRVLAGGSELDIQVSQWMIIITFLLSISLAFSKRRNDLIINVDKKELRKSLQGYTLQFLDIAMGISFSITLISYIMYSISNEVKERLTSENLYITSFFVFMGIMRYLQITIVSNKSGSPITILWKDKLIQLTIVCWLLLFTIILYGNNLQLEWFS